MKKLDPSDIATGRRIKALRKDLGLTQDEFGRRVGLSRGAVGNWELGQGAKRESLLKVAEEFGVSFEWLATGRGEQRPEDGDLRLVPIGEEFDPDPVVEDEALGAAAEMPFSGSIPDSQPEVDARAGAGPGEVGETVNVRSGGIVTGHRVVSEWRLPPEYLRHELRSQPNRTWILEVVGDSMEPTLYPGDRVIVDTSHQQIVPDGVYVIDEGDGPMVKRLHRLRDHSPPAVEIRSDNPHQPSYTLSMDRFRVVGRVCGRVTRM